MFNKAGDCVGIAFARFVDAEATGCAPFMASCTLVSSRRSHHFGLQTQYRRRSSTTF